MAISRLAKRWRRQDSGDLAAQFERLGPWVTKFSIAGREYGGWFDAMNDGRIQEFRRVFPGARRILELGSLEGGHSLGLARLPGITQIVALEGRKANLARAEFVKRLLAVRNVTFQQADLEQPGVLPLLGTFDAVYCCGLLYHLPRPWELLRQIAAVTPNLYLSTHYCPPDKTTVELQGYQGVWFAESGLRDPLSGLSQRSFWPTAECLVRMLHDVGFDQVTVLHAEKDHPNGPIVTLAARRSE